MFCGKTAGAVIETKWSYKEQETPCVCFCFDELQHKCRCCVKKSGEYELHESAGAWRMNRRQTKKTLLL